MEKYFKEVAGFDKVYVAPTKKYLESLDGIGSRLGETQQ